MEAVVLVDKISADGYKLTLEHTPVEHVAGVVGTILTTADLVDWQDYATLSVTDLPAWMKIVQSLGVDNQRRH